jgi:hypothetical protein
MRVSRTFEALAAPLLYEKLDWKGWKEGHWPVAVNSKDHRGRIVKAGSSEEELRLIKTIELRHHFVKDCPRSFGARYRRQPLKLPVLHLWVGQMDATLRTEYDSAKAICLTGVSCSLLAELAPRKIVVRTDGYCNNPTIHWGRINQDQLNCQVVQLDLSQTHRWALPEIPLESVAKRLVIVLTPPRDFTALFATVTRTVAACMWVIAAQLSTKRRLQNFPSDIVLVNFGVLDAQFPTNPSGKFEDICKIANSAPLAREKGVVYKTESEMKLVTFKFVTMREYLTTYDWHGEYTKEEAAQSLADEIEREKAIEVEGAAEAQVE